MTTYILIGAAITVLVVVFIIFYVYRRQPIKYGEDFIQGYWLMNLSDQDDNLLDEQVLYIEKLKNKNYNFIYAFDEDEDPITTEYKTQAQKPKYYRKHIFDFKRVDGDGPKNLKVTMDTINGILNLTNDDVSYGLFCKDNTLN